MWVFYLEAAIATGLFIFILWWTLAPARKKDKGAKSASAAPKDAERHSTTDSQPPID